MKGGDVTLMRCNAGARSKRFVSTRSVHLVTGNSTVGVIQPPLPMPHFHRRVGFVLPFDWHLSLGWELYIHDSRDSEQLVELVELVSLHHCIVPF